MTIETNENSPSSSAISINTSDVAAISLPDVVEPLVENGFLSLGLDEQILRAIADEGYLQPTPIQSQAIPIVLSGKDLLGGAQTGTGKTAAFTLPILQLLLPLANSSPSPAKHPLRALILTPTRELALQVHQSVIGYSKHLALRSCCVYGGVDIKPQIEILRNGVEILVATPGRLLDHYESKSINFSQVSILVMDEADRMLDMGFLPDISRIQSLLPKVRQGLLFSATFSNEIKKLADTILQQPVLIEVAKRNTVSELIKHRVHPVTSEQKKLLLQHILLSEEVGQVIVFVRTKLGCSHLLRDLLRVGVSADAIHGDKTQVERVRALEQFKKGEINVLVATDVAARGLDIDELPFVINYELPHTPEDYVHRIGRTGRAGHSGNAISLVTAEEVVYLMAIERLIGIKVEQSIVDGFNVGFGYDYPLPAKRALRNPTEQDRQIQQQFIASLPRYKYIVKKSANTNIKANVKSNTTDNVRRTSRSNYTSKNQSTIAADGFDFSQPYVAAKPDGIENQANSSSLNNNSLNKNKAKKPLAALLTKKDNFLAITPIINQ